MSGSQFQSALLNLIRHQMTAPNSMGVEQTPYGPMPSYVSGDTTVRPNLSATAGASNAAAATAAYQPRLTAPPELTALPGATARAALPPPGGSSGSGGAMTPLSAMQMMASAGNGGGGGGVVPYTYHGQIMPPPGASARISPRGAAPTIDGSLGADYPLATRTPGGGVGGVAGGYGVPTSRFTDPNGVPIQMGSNYGIPGFPRIPFLPPWLIAGLSAMRPGVLNSDETEQLRPKVPTDEGRNPAPPAMSPMPGGPGMSPMPSNQPGAAAGPQWQSNVWGGGNPYAETGATVQNGNTRVNSGVSPAEPFTPVTMTPFAEAMLTAQANGAPTFEYNGGVYDAGTGQPVQQGGQPATQPATQPAAPKPKAAPRPVSKPASKPANAAPKPNLDGVAERVGAPAPSLPPLPEQTVGEKPAVAAPASESFWQRLGRPVPMGVPDPGNTQG